jgi:hypothetical protein
MPPYEVQKMTFDAAHPWAVLATFRSFNRVIARYADERQAKRRARDLNKKTANPIRKYWSDNLGKFVTIPE